MRCPRETLQLAPPQLPKKTLARHPARSIVRPPVHLGSLACARNCHLLTSRFRCSSHASCNCRTDFTHIELRVKTDGRNFVCSIQTAASSDFACFVFFFMHAPLIDAACLFCNGSPLLIKRMCAIDAARAGL